MTKIIFTYHARSRVLERKMDIFIIKNIAKFGDIIKIQDSGTIIKGGLNYDNRKVIVVCKEQNNKIIIKTAYYED